MKLKILIVDDESHIRIGISKMLEIKTLEAEISGFAENARVALEIVKRDKPHIVITDIRMPDEDGLSLAKQILEYNPDTNIVFISGFDDFEYARNAMKLGVREYVLKPLNKEVLNKILFRIKMEVERDAAERENASKYKEKLFSGYSYAKTKFLEGIIEGRNIDEKELAEKEKLFNITLQGNLCLILIYIGDVEKQNDDKWANKNLLKFSIANIAEEIIGFGTREYTLYPNEQEILILCHAEGDQPIKEIHSRALDIISSVMTFLQVDICIAYNAYSSRLFELSQVHSMLWIALLNKFINGGKVFEASWHNTLVNKNVRFPWEKKLQMYIEFNDFAKISELIDDIFGYEKGSVNFSAESLFLVLWRIYHMACRISSRNGIEDSNGNAQVINRVMKNISIEQVKNTLKDDILSAIKEKNPVYESENKMAITLAKQYINQHYQDDVSENQVADYLNISPQYLSTLFKKYVGENFINYLTDLRIENSKRLLEQENLKVYEIASRVGYYDPKHYIRIFKKITGVTPNEYREKYAAGSISLGD